MGPASEAARAEESKAGFAGFFPRFGTGMPAKLGEGTRLGKASGDCGHRRWQRDAGAEKCCWAPFFGYESADPTHRLSSLLSLRCAILSDSDQD